MLLFEHGCEGEHPPPSAAFGSQSCALSVPFPLTHVAWHAEDVTPFDCITQHTVPTAQFAADVQPSAVVSPPPPAGRGHVVPATHA